MSNTKKKQYNNDVPEQTVLRNEYKNALFQIGVLKSDIAELQYELDKAKDELQRKTNAIRDFKVWQKKTLESGWKGILAESIRLLDTFPPKEEVQPLFDFLAHREDFLERVERLEKAYIKTEETAKIAREIKEKALRNLK